MTFKIKHGFLKLSLFLTEEQAQFNKFVRDEVAKKYGENFLLEHEVNQLETPVMDKIKGKYLSFLSQRLYEYNILNFLLFN